MSLIPLDDLTATRLADLFSALGDPTRVRIVAALREGEATVSGLARQIGLTKSAISHQLRGLKEKRLVRARKQGRQVFVAIDDEHVTELFQKGLEHAQHG
ncbi:MAG: metalloregulator ArsR/SmtB family transcription factor [Anaerolineales bacterium]|nr:metalloregulator ArsR/SmtB family transcription factor [Anaerolineales bacterium]MCX7756656.1 metalloregulator ArsR/SmtB family transcription factor [Anaerolineales bacterium]MDW8277269.1 metalloregulator ArsR/SmtB family transcription factor [Anaerolineales bacterium]